MPKKEFNDALASYLNEKRRRKKTSAPFKESVSSLFKRTAPSDQIPELEEGKVHIIQGRKSFLGRLREKREERARAKREAKQPAGQAEISDSEFESEEEEMQQEIEESPTFRERMQRWWNQLMRRREGPEEESPDGTTAEASSEEMVEELEDIESKEEELIEKEEELHQKKEGLLTRLARLFSSPAPESRQVKETDEVEEETVSRAEYDEMRQDMQEIAQFTMQVIHSLPKRKIEDLKDSEQLKRFKETLRKYELVRE